MTQAQTALFMNCSPRTKGECGVACDRAAAQLEHARPHAAILRLDVGRLNVAPCVGCERCLRTGECFQHDEMPQVLRALQAADQLYVACPVYFAGPPAQAKAVLDRFQALYGEYDRARTAHALPPKRPARLLVVGAGGDPNGYEPVVTCMRSALAVAGFALEYVQPAIACTPNEHDWLGL